MRQMGFMMMVAMVLAVNAGTGAGTYGGGAGTGGDPYRIGSTAHWTSLVSSPGDWGSQFILTADLDFGGAAITPVGNSGTPFTGILDGAGHTLSNLKIDQPTGDNMGLFGYVGAGGQVRNLGLVNANIKGSIYVGGLVGYNAGTITSCYATGSVTGDWGSVGGLVGINVGSITSCYATGPVTGSGDAGDCVGGLVGYAVGTITSCYAIGAVSGASQVGGLVGYFYSGTITSCYATGAVSGTNEVGGLAGLNSNGTLTSCYATGTVTGSEQSVGGLAGRNGGTISSCYATGTIRGTSPVGGLVGYSYSGTITSCYATGTVTGSGNYVGGLVGGNYQGTTNGCFWDILTSWQTISAGGTGKTTVEMKRQSTFTDARWDFENVWGIVENESYPTLRAFWQPGSADLNGDGKVDLADFALFAEQWMK